MPNCTPKSKGMLNWLDSFGVSFVVVTYCYELARLKPEERLTSIWFGEMCCEEQGLELLFNSKDLVLYYSKARAP